ncbi:MAG TPA: efflux RND transporter periplasmic adaptor subunit [Planctomycetota bacterium]|nr:efflux RND transporter periplasmic adaptor subunit [Planctomycetota bacterium]
MCKFVVFCFCLMFIVCGCKEAKKTVEVPLHRVKVHCDILREHDFAKMIRVQGTIQAIERAGISARISGTLDFLKVDHGDAVKKGDVLFQIDQVNLENSVALAKEDLRVAEDIEYAAKVDLEIARTQLEKIQLDYKRNKKLFESKAISIGMFEEAEVALKNAMSSERKLEAVLRYNSTKVKQAKVLLEIAQKNLADSIIKAPFDSVVTSKSKEEKEFVVAGTPILYLENQSQMELSCIISAVYYKYISLNTPIFIYFNGELVCKTKLRFIAPAVDPLSRTFEIQADFPRNANVISGTLCDVDIVLAESCGLGLPRDAVLLRKGGQYIAYEVVQDRAKQVAIVPGIHSHGFIEVLNANDLKNKKIVIHGQYFLNDNSLVDVTKDFSKKK